MSRVVERIEKKDTRSKQVGFFVQNGHQYEVRFTPAENDINGNLFDRFDIFSKLSNLSSGILHGQLTLGANGDRTFQALYSKNFEDRVEHPEYRGIMRAAIKYLVVEHGYTWRSDDTELLSRRTNTSASHLYESLRNEVNNDPLALVTCEIESSSEDDMVFSYYVLKRR